MASGSKLWTVFSLGTALGSAAVARKALDKGWQVATGKKPPQNPADPDIDVWEAALWAAVTGAFVSLARMTAQRRAASYYQRSTGQLPPELRRDGK